MTFELTILGSNSALPAHKRHPSAQILNIRDQLFLLDCGEGTQIRFNDLKIKRARIDHIFITHLHGDHYFGLIGLINSYNLLGREKPLHIYAGSELKDITIYQLNASDTKLRFPLIFHELNTHLTEQIYENDSLSVSTVVLKHRIPCVGFVFREKPQARIIKGDKVRALNIPYDAINRIKRGEDYTTEEGITIDNKELSLPPHKSRSFAYITDTAYSEAIVENIRGVDLLYHEATFGNDSAERAIETFHSTAEDAAKIAALAGVKRLLIGHFSSKYKELDHLQEEAREIFPQTDLALEGSIFKVERNSEELS